MLDDPANALFVDDLNEGRVPAEMREGTTDADRFDFAIDDSKMKSPAPFAAFRGQGQVSDTECDDCNSYNTTLQLFVTNLVVLLLLHFFLSLSLSLLPLDDGWGRVLRLRE